MGHLYISRKTPLNRTSGQLNLKIKNKKWYLKNAGEDLCDKRFEILKICYLTKFRIICYPLKFKTLQGNEDWCNCSSSETRLALDMTHVTKVTFQPIWVRMYHYIKYMYHYKQHLQWKKDFIQYLYQSGRIMQWK